jgi:hypothetical protein
MITTGQVWDEIASVVGGGNDTLESMKRSCQMSYYQLIGLLSWEECRKKVSATLSAAAATLLPADMVNIEAVWDPTNEIEYFPGRQWGSIIRPTWFTLDPVTDALALLSGITVNSLANVWTGGTWDASYIGEYIRFGKEPGIYKITAENAFTPRYYGPKLDRVTGHIRPAKTKQVACVDDGGDRVSGAMDIYYWAYPSPLYDESQDIMLPASRPLELQTLIRMLGTKDRRENAADRYRDEYREALEQMKAMNPRFTQPGEPTNRIGYSPFNMQHR